ncbi:MAG TPA: efflux RND transporter permease subunit [Kofleriaceae bacterium]
MNLSGPFIRRPIATSLLALALLLGGGAAFTQLSVGPLPKVDLATISVSASLPGGSPTTMATSVAMPLERRMARIAGISELTSTSALGTTSITAQFSLDRDIEGAARDVQAAINAAGGDLPPNLPTRPTFRKVNPSDSPILILALRSKTLPLPRVFEAANTVLAQKISQVPGVGQVGVGGGVQPAVRIRYNPMQIASMGLSVEDLRNAIAAATSDQPKGGIGASQYAAIGVDDQLMNAQQWANIIVRSSTTDQAVGGAVRLGDIGQVFDDVENERVAGWFDGERAVMVIIRRTPGANILDVIDRVKALLPQLAASIPAGIDIDVAIDRATTIRASVHDVERTLLISVILVILVVLLFLQSWRATSVPGLVVPLALVATFGVMFLLDYSLDNLSLMALTIATGFVVDDAIVVTENVARHIENGSRPFKAALEGAREIGFTIVSITTSLIAVFIPLLFMGGVVGRLFREFAMVLTIAIVWSALLSLTLTPMMCSRLLKPRHERGPGPVARTIERTLERIVQRYGKMLWWVIRNRVIVGIITIATVVLTVELYRLVPFGLLPQQDTGMLVASSRGPQDISFAAMKQRQEELIKVLEEDPDVEHAIGSVGGWGSSTINTGSMFISLRPKPARKSSADQVIARLRPKVAKVDGIAMRFQSVQDLRVGGRSSDAQYQYALQDADLNELNQWAPRVVAALMRVPQLKDVNSDQQTQGLELDLKIDRDTASRLGVAMADIDNTLYDAFGQRQVAVFYTEVNQYRVVLEADPSIGTGPDALDRIYVPGAGGAQIPLSQLVKISRNPVALSIGHQGQFPATTLSFNLAPGVALGDAVKAVEDATAKIGMPASVHGTFAGTAQAFQDSLKSERILVPIAIFFVYIVLGILYESYIHPITILSTLPSAGLGALLGLLVTGTDLSLMAIIGIILLVGIVKKNAILIIDFALEREREGMDPEKAIHQACMLRFRPILMTTLAALFGALPLALGRGTGAELRVPLGIAIVGGLMVSQILTLFTTPVTYLALHRFQRRRRNPESLGDVVERHSSQRLGEL